MPVNPILSGLFKATLEEDFITTVRETGRPYCKAKITEFQEQTTEYPYTLVPLDFMIYPLKKGDVVTIQFFDGDVQYPVLFNYDGDVPSSVLDTYTPPAAGSLVKVPTLSDTFSYTFYSENIFTLYQDNCIITHNQDSVVFQSKDEVKVFTKKWGAKATDIQLEGTFEATTLGWKVTNTGNFQLNSNSLELIALLKSMISAIKAIGITTTCGAGPGTGVVTPITGATALDAVDVQLTTFKG